MVEILIISAKLATLALLKIKVFWYKGYEVIISANDAFIKILKIFIKIWPEKTIFLRGTLDSSSTICDWH